MKLSKTSTILTIATFSIICIFFYINNTHYVEIKINGDNNVLPSTKEIKTAMITSNINLKEIDSITIQNEGSNIGVIVCGKETTEHPSSGISIRNRPCSQSFIQKDNLVSSIISMARHITDKK